nr:fractalkine [Pelodiscus sinensis]|eukprot:XP_025042170.1 fractalkine [Pelodiscus sinensis]
MKGTSVASLVLLALVATCNLDCGVEGLEGGDAAIRITVRTRNIGDGSELGLEVQISTDSQPRANVPCKYKCTKFSKRIPQALLKSYEKTEPSCPKAAVIFVTQKSKEFCADPEESWVQEAVRWLDQTSAPQDPPPSSTVSSAAVPEDIGDLERLIGGTASVPRQAGVLTSPIPGAGTTVSQAVHGSGVRTEEPNTSTLTVQEAMRSSATPCSALNGTGPPSTIYTEPTANGSKGSMRSVDSANKSTDSAMSPATEVSATVPSRFIADPTTAVKLPESPTGPTYKSVSSSRN